MNNLEDLLNEEGSIMGDPESDEAMGGNEIDTLKELKDYVEENSSVQFRGANTETTSSALIKKAMPTNSKIGVGSFSRLAELISEKSGIKINKRQTAAAWYYILYQIFHNKE